MPDTDLGHRDSVINKIDSSEDSIWTKGLRTRLSSLLPPPPHNPTQRQLKQKPGLWDLSTEQGNVLSSARASLPSAPTGES